MMMTTIFLKIINQPLLSYLDVTILGIGIFLACTSQHIQISGSKIKSQPEDIYHYALSRRTDELTKESAEILAKLILQLKQPSVSQGSRELLKGRQGVFHLLIKKKRDRLK